MLKRLTRPINRKIDKVKMKVHGFVDPIKNGISTLRGKLPVIKSRAGSEASESENAEEQESPKKLGLLDRLKSFKQSLNEMSDLQKLILLVIAICLPAGFLIATVLVKFLKSRKKK